MKDAAFRDNYILFILHILNYKLNINSDAVADKITNSCVD